ncbi:hypothetical protein Tco_0398418 [Tanacetum coccineum]
MQLTLSLKSLAPLVFTLMNQPRQLTIRGSSGLLREAKTYLAPTLFDWTPDGSAFASLEILQLHTTWELIALFCPPSRARASYRLRVIFTALNRKRQQHAIAGKTVNRVACYAKTPRATLNLPKNNAPTCSTNDIRAWLSRKDHADNRHRNPPYTSPTQWWCRRGETEPYSDISSMRVNQPFQISFWDYALETVARNLNMVQLRSTRPDVAFASEHTKPDSQQNLCDLYLTTGFLDYTDAGYLTDSEDLKTQTRICVCFEWRCLLTWRELPSKHFSLLSICRTEYIAEPFDASKEAVWLGNSILGSGVVPTIEKPINMYCEILEGNR